MPLLSKTPAVPLSSSGKITPFWKPSPIHSDTPTIVAFFAFTPSSTTILIPCTKSSANVTVTYATNTGRGIATISASTLGKSATAIRMQPA